LSFSSIVFQQNNENDTRERKLHNIKNIYICMHVYYLEEKKGKFAFVGIRANSCSPWDRKIAL